MKSSKNLPIIERLEHLRRAKRWTWDELAEQLDVSRTTLHYLRKGRHEPTGRLLRSLEEAEEHAGLVGAKSATQANNSLIEALQTSLASAQVIVRPEDHDRGYVNAKLEYLRGTPPKGHPIEIKLSRPPSNKRAELLTTVLQSQDYNAVLLTCMPQDNRTEDFLNMLTPFCITAMTDAAMNLVFGSDWKSHVRAPGK